MSRIVDPVIAAPGRVRQRPWCGPPLIKNVMWLMDLRRMMLSAALLCALVFVASAWQVQRVRADDPVPAIVLVPAGNAENADVSIPAANLWLCIAASCIGPGEGTLDVVMRALGIATGDANADGEQDGAGSYDIDVDHDLLAIEFLVLDAFGDIAFSPVGAGAGRAPASCQIDNLWLELFNCTTSAGDEPAGPTGDFDVATLRITPRTSDLTNAMRPGLGNQLLTVVELAECRVADVRGTAVAGSLPNGGLPRCGDLAVTIRILQGDVNLDCAVDVQDLQIIAFHLGSALPDPLYAAWYDIEPNAPDGDLDISDLQRVSGRDGSTCQEPIPWQPPQQPPVPFS